MIFKDNERQLDKVKKINVNYLKMEVYKFRVKNKYTNRALNKLVYRLSEINNDIKFVEDYDKLATYDFSIYMINSNYINLNVNRKKLFEILTMKKIKSKKMY